MRWLLLGSRAASFTKAFAGTWHPAAALLATLYSASRGSGGSVRRASLPLSSLVVCYVQAPLCFIFALFSLLRVLGALPAPLSLFNWLLGFPLATLVGGLSSDGRAWGYVS